MEELAARPNASAEALAVAEAVIMAEPSETAVTMPFGSTVATLALLVDHNTVAPTMSIPWSSRTRAANLTVFPTGAHSSGAVTSTLAAAGEAVTTSTCTDAEQLFVVSDSPVAASTHAP